MTAAELKITTNYITALASQPDAQERISLFLSGLLAMQPKDNSNMPRKKKCVSTLIHFTQKEISKMAKTFKKEFIGNGLAAHVLKRDLYKKPCITLFVIVETVTKFKWEQPRWKRLRKNSLKQPERKTSKNTAKRKSALRKILSCSSPKNGWSSRKTSLTRARIKIMKVIVKDIYTLF